MRNVFLGVVLVLATSVPALAVEPPQKRDPPKTVVQQIQELKATVEALAAKVQQLEAQNKAVLDALSTKPAEQGKAARSPSDTVRVARAIAAKDIVPGMTRDQAREVVKARGDVAEVSSTESKSAVFETWDFRQPSTITRVSLENGIVTAVSR